jgi:glutamate formiminotransferase/formiminotetrahydrofolate cyclodeaminase
LLINLSLGDFCKAIAEKNPTPGGGSASAYAGAMGASLVAMFCSLTASKKKYVEVKEYMEQVAAYALEGQGRLLSLVDADSRAYEKVLAANRMPKDSEAEIELRERAVAEATLEATQAPLATASCCLEVLERVPGLAEKGNPNVLSDLKVGTELLWTAFQGGLANVEINLPWLPENEAEGIRDRVLDLVVRAQKTLETIRGEISGKE